MSEYGMMIITGCIIVLGIYEMMTVFWKNKPGYLSTIMQRAGFKAPFIVFAIGFLCGHWWGYFPPDPEIKIVTVMSGAAMAASQLKKAA